MRLTVGVFRRQETLALLQETRGKMGLAARAEVVRALQELLAVDGRPPEATPAHRQISRLENAVEKVVVSDTLTQDETQQWSSRGPHELMHDVRTVFVVPMTTARPTYVRGGQPI